MKITSEKSIVNFEFWGGAKDIAAALTDKELETIEGILEDIYPDGIDETTLNDIFAFEGDTIAEWLGYKYEEYFLCHKDAKYLLLQVKDLLERVREDNFTPEFTLGDADEYMRIYSMSRKSFLDGGWKFYVAEDSHLDVEDIDEDTYEDTLQYVKLEALGRDIFEVAMKFEDRKSASREVFAPDGEGGSIPMSEFGEKLTEAMESVRNLMYKEDAELSEKLSEDIMNCEDLCMGEKKKVEEEDEKEI